MEENNWEVKHAVTMILFQLPYHTGHPSSILSPSLVCLSWLQSFSHCLDFPLLPNKWIHCHLMMWFSYACLPPTLRPFILMRFCPIFCLLFFFHPISFSKLSTCSNSILDLDFVGWHWINNNNEKKKEFQIRQWRETFILGVSAYKAQWGSNVMPRWVSVADTADFRLSWRGRTQA